MIDYARLRPGPGFRPRQALFYYAQRAVPWRGLRRRVAGGIAWVVRRGHGAGGDGAANPATADRLATLERQGLVMLPGLVAPDAARTMLEYFRAQPVVGRDGASVALAHLPVGTGAAPYALRTVLECPGLVDLLHAPAVLDTAAGYLGCKPTLSSLGVRWSFPGGAGPQPTQLFHRDPDDWRFLKLFVYLTDVDAGHGPHQYVLGTHRTNGQWRERPQDMAELERRYGEGRLHTVIGPAGTAFMADTYGIHAGAVPTAGARLIVQVQYSLLPVFAFRYQPVALTAQPSYDRYTDRLLFRAAPAPFSAVRPASAP